MSLETDLAEVLNKYSMENASGTPDFILAHYLVGCLDAFNVAVSDRAAWSPPITADLGVAETDG